ncbi:hypothetical protein SESBI_37478, partial [Sesbania bispinosa]
CNGVRRRKWCLRWRKRGEGCEPWRCVERVGEGGVVLVEEFIRRTEKVGGFGGEMKMVNSKFEDEEEKEPVLAVTSNVSGGLRPPEIQ